MMEFVAFLGLYFCLSDSFTYSVKRYALYFFLGALASVYFVRAEQPILILNIILYVLILLLSFGRIPYINSIRVSICSIPLMLILEFILHSLLPVSSLQTDAGNLITNTFLIIIIFSLLFFLQRRRASSLVSAFFIRYFPIIIIFAAALVILGQVYLSRLTTIWSYLPGLIALIVFLSFVVVIYAVVCILRPSAVVDAFSSGRCAEQNGRRKNGS